jgi:hypothetical protein
VCPYDTYEGRLKIQKKDKVITDSGDSECYNVRENCQGQNQKGMRITCMSLSSSSTLS